MKTVERSFVNDFQRMRYEQCCKGLESMQSMFSDRELLRRQAQKLKEDVEKRGY